jgi:predicted DNA binding CopG/RHH family protein
MATTKRRKAQTDAVREIHARLFEDDVKTIQRIAKEKGLPWQIELRLLVRRTLKNEVQKVLVLDEEPTR